MSKPSSQGSQKRTMERSIRFNNAGVDCIEAGHNRIAWDLFKGALEVKLAVERCEKQGVKGDFAFRSMRNSYVEKAEEHMVNIEKYLQQDRQNRAELQNGNQSQYNSNAQRMTVEQASSDVVTYAPFLFAHPMRLRCDSSSSSRRESATIIFNLALVDHMKNRCSEQAVALYELAMTLLTGDTVDLLGIALVNNIGVWCYENGDIDGALSCMGHLATFVNACGVEIDQGEKEGLYSNILWLTNMPFAASPAA